MCKANTLVLDNLYLTHLPTEKQEDENHTTKPSQLR